LSWLGFVSQVKSLFSKVGLDLQVAIAMPGLGLVGDADQLSLQQSTFKGVDA
jgi:hypothetical protein